MDPIKKARLHELRALKAARESKKCLNANESTPPGNGMVESENRAPAAPADHQITTHVNSVDPQQNESEKAGSHA